MIIPVISIVIANYNYGRFLESAIKSVVEQDGFDQCELIVVDAASTDNSVDIIKHNSDKIAWWCSEEDQGQSDAFNKGFSYAHGKFFTWLNADDVFLPGAIRAVLDAIDSHPQFEWFAGGTAYFTDSGIIRTATVPLGNVIPRLLCVPAWMRVSGPSSFFSRNLLARVGKVDLSLRFVMDIDLWMRFTRQGAKLYVIDQYLWGFRVHDESKTSSSITSGQINDKFARERLEIRSRNKIDSFGEKAQLMLKRLSGMITFGYLMRKWFVLEANRRGVIGVI